MSVNQSGLTTIALWVIRLWRWMTRPLRNREAPVLISDYREGASKTVGNYHDFSCDECGGATVVLVQDVTDDYDPNYYCAEHDPRKTEAGASP